MRIMDVVTSIILVVLYYVLPMSWANFIMEPLNDKLYVNLGDLNLGGIFSITAYDPDRPCGDRIAKFYQIEVAETMVYAIHEINKILPVTIGYVITDACDKEATAAIQALRFLPHSPEETEYNTGDPSLLQTFDVIGVVGTDQSFTTKPAAMVLNAANIPIVSFWASDISLDDKALYPNFQRVIYSDEDLIHAIVHYIVLNNFTYLAILYEEDLPVIDLFDALLAENIGAKYCNPIELMVTKNDNFEEIVDQLIQDERAARIVVVLAHDEITEKIIRAVMRTETEGELLWLGGDSWMHIMLYLGGPKGSISVSHEAIQMSGFKQYFRSLDSNTTNPWFLQGMMDNFGCTTNKCILDVMSNLELEPGLAYIYQAVMVYGTALAEFFGTYCSEAVERGALECFRQNSEKFLPLLQKKTQTLLPGNMKADVTKDDWRLSVYQSEGEKGKVKLLQNLDLTNHSSTSLEAINTSLLTFNENMLNAETYCTPPCKFGEYRFYVTKCCWSCRPCKENAIVSDKGTECLPCPELHWPQMYVGTTGVCLEILPHHISISGPFSMFLFICSMMGVSTVMGTLGWYKRNRDNELVKASSIELSCAQLLSFSCGYLGIPVLLSRPSDFNCALGVLMITLSVNILYVIMLFKAIRVHRIFNLSKKNARIAYTSQKFQICACFAFFIFEVSRFIIANHYNPITVNVFQPEREIRYTELTCSVPIMRMFLFLVYNFIMLLACCVLAFKTQTLPTRFKESKYVAMCVITTLMIMSAITPVYFTAVHRVTRMQLLMVSLLINHSTAYVFLFLTRIVAVEQVKWSRRRTAVMHAHTPRRRQAVLHRTTEGDVHSINFKTRNLKSLMPVSP